MSIGTKGLLLAVCLAISMPAATRPGEADHRIPQPTDRVVLTVSGDIQHMNVPGAAEFDMAMLRGLQLRDMQTTTPWTDGTQNFRGIPMQALMDYVGARGSKVEAIALNDYSQEIAIEDFSRYPVLLVLELNGETLRIRDKGPLWIVYPRDEFPELRSLEVDRRMVWQLRWLVVK